MIMKYLVPLSVLLFSLVNLTAQTSVSSHFFGCGTDALRAATLKNDSSCAERENKFEVEYRFAVTAAHKGTDSPVLTLPIVVHIIHDNGPENISDAQVLKGIGYLNDAFRNRNYYNPATGVDVEIEFCLAKRDMQGKAFSGIARYQSPLTDMSLKLGAPYTLTNWDTKNYINIILVREACLFGDCSGVAGYATLPGTHGQPGEGIVMEAKYFGASPIETTVLVHEMGHYLGLMHTFQGGCKNDNCLQDGDRVCDTPPDNSTGYYPCNALINSCHTDTDDPSMNNPFRSPALGGLGDQPDQYRNYMDYSVYACYDRFSEGQKLRMRFFVEGTRAALLNSKACLPPCPTPVLVQFTTKDSVEVGDTLLINNQTQQANAYNWYLDGQLVSTSTQPALTLNQTGEYVLRLEAVSPLTECDAGIAEKTITVYCPVVAAFDYTIQDQQLIIISTSSQADSLLWVLKDGAGNVVTTSNVPIDTFDLGSLPYVQLCLLALNAHCAQQACTYIKLIVDGIEICENGLDDDYDGLTDRFDPDCSCDSAYYQAVCPIECEYVPDTFPMLSLNLKWVSEVLADHRFYNTGIVTGDIDNDGNIEVVAPKSIGDWTLNNVKNHTVILNASDGKTDLDFTFTNQGDFYAISNISMADVDFDGKAELFSILFNTILCYSHDGTLLWESDPLKDQVSRVVNIADFNADGIPELYVGNQILNAQTGKLLASGSVAEGCSTLGSIIPGCYLKHTIASDLLSSPGLELAAGNTVYQVSITNPIGTTGNSMTPVIATGSVTDGFTSVGDINGDGQLDIVVVQSKTALNGGGIWVWDPRTRATIASAAPGASGGVAFIGNVQGDCKPEIGMTFEKELRMYEFDGSPQLKLLYSLPTTDKSGYTGITMFDFNQDGKQELVYRDETELRVLEGATGKTLAAYPIKSGTAMEYPVIADVDKDGHADILVNGYQSNNPFDNRVYCFESGGTPWAPARSVWNQYGYNVTNVNDDLTIPRYPQNPATPLPGFETCLQPTCPAPYNAFFAQATYRTQQGCVQFPAVDISLKILSYECTPDSLIFHIAVDRLSSKAAGKDSLYISSYAEKPQPGIVPVETVCRPVNPNGPLHDTLRLAWPLPSGIDRMYFVVNDPGSGANADNFPLTGIIECNYTNNSDSIRLDLAPHSLDLGPNIVKCESAVLTFNAGAGFESYLWSDGTQDSIYSSGYAGLHFVEATDHCQRVYRDTVQVTITPAGSIDLGPDTVICPGEPLSFSLSGDFDFIQWLPAGNVDCDTCMQVNAVTDTSLLLMAVAGKGNCFSVDTVAIDIKPAPHRAFAYSVCAGDSVQVSGQWLSGAGTHTVLVNAITGCDTIYDVTLSEIPLVSKSETVSICAGDSVLLFNHWVSQAGPMSQTFTSAAGCDSTQTYTVMVTPLNHKNVAYSLCAGDSIQVGGQWLSGVGTHSVLVNAASGCDAIYEVTLSEIPLISTSETVSICAGDSVFLFNQWVSQAGVLSQTFTSAAGCDSTQTYTVTVTSLNHKNVAVGICAGDSIQVGGQWLSGTGQHSVIVHATSGCDTIYDVTLSEIPLISNSEAVSLCAGDSVFLFNQWVNQAGTLSQTFTSTAGCDSIQTYTVTVDPLNHKNVAYTLCAGDSVQVGGQWLSDAGIYSVLVHTTSGCDTLYDVTLSEIPLISNSETVSICVGDSVYLFNQWVNQAGTLSQTFTSAAGCDSTQTYTVTVTPLNQKNVAYTLCTGDSIQIGGQWLSGAGLHSILVSALGGCDTIYDVTLSEIPLISNSETVSICTGDSVFLFNKWVNQAGTLNQTFASSNGCDSTQTYEVLVTPLTHQTVAYNICAGDSVQVGGQWLSGAGMYSVPVTAVAGCDTIFDISLTTIPAIIQSDTLVLCPGDSVWINNAWIKESSTLSEVYAAASGCDSIQITVVSTLEAPVPPSAQIDCDNLDVLLHIQAAVNWAILWSNGDTLRQTVYKNDDTARVTLHALPDCHIEFNLALPTLPDTTQLPGLPDTTLYVGQSVAFDLGLDPADWQVRWEPSAIFSCDTCLSTIALPTKSTTVEVTFAHRSGCTYGSRFLISLRKASDFYVPNVFSPNGDGINDFWSFVPPGGIERFEEVLIFDRWGNQLADWKDVPNVAWDGTFRGKALNPAVFAYYIRFFDSSGERVEKIGDVTLVR